MLSTYLGFNNPLIPSYIESKGIFLKDSHKKIWIDLFSNYSSLPLGHNFEKLENLLDEKKYLMYERAPLCAFNHKEVNDFILEFEKIVPNNFQNISFAENGGLANEQIMKAFLYKGSIDNKKIRFYVFNGSYHGIAGLSLLLTSASRSALARTNFIETFENISVRSLENVNCDFFDEPNTIHVLFVEPLKCTKGDIKNSKNEYEIINYFKEQDNFFLVYDEIQTGLYPLINPWGYQFYKFPDPDVISFGKRFQVSGFCSNSFLSDVFDNTSPKLLSSTFDGSLIDLVRGTFYIKYLREYFLKKEPQIIKNFELLSTILSSLGNKFGGQLDKNGTYLSLKFPEEKSMKNCSNFLTSIKILHNPTLPKTIRFRAPININIDDIDVIKKRIENN